jgi:hypothetical protein
MSNKEQSTKRYARVYLPDSFEQENHFYQKAINAPLHSIVSNFVNLGNDRIVSRYCHLNPKVDANKLKELLQYKPKYFKWSGCDLFNVTTKQGSRMMVLIETNSCPSGQKSMPLLQEHDEYGGYRSVIEKTFKPYVEEKEKEGALPEGSLAVVYDKNEMEASGYAATIAEVFQQPVYLVEFYLNDKNPCVRFNKDHVMEVELEDGTWIPIKAAFRYVTQKPWNRIPLINCKTLIMNPIVACISGGRNKLLASKAYNFLNAELDPYGIRINVPKTIHNVEKEVVPLWVEALGGYAAVKNPYSNAGQGVWTITTEQELKDFMKLPYAYDQYIVQSLIGNSNWSSVTHRGKFYHVGTVPDKQKRIYVADIRMMIHYNYQIGGFAPVALYARRAEKPLENKAPGSNSWEVLGTNLSIKTKDGGWLTDEKRLIVVAQNSFNKLGLGVDDLINAYVQAVLATVAIDKLAKRFVSDGKFHKEIFSSLNKDKTYVDEILI